MKTWFITGCSSGLGKSLAKKALDHGDQVVVTARKLESLKEFEAYENALILPLDVTDSQSIDQSIQNALATFGKVDILVNNAGYGLRGAVEEASPQEIEKVYQTNLFGRCFFTTNLTKLS